MLSSVFKWIGRLVAIGFIAALPFHESVTAASQMEECAPLASRLGAENVWFGQVSGTTSSPVPWAEMGCFPTEAECRVWYKKNLHTGSDMSWVMACQKGAPSWSMRSEKK